MRRKSRGLRKMSHLVCQVNCLGFKVEEEKRRQNNKKMSSKSEVGFGGRSREEERRTGEERSL